MPGQKRTGKPSIDELERKTKVAEAAVLRARADVLRLEDRLEKVDIERAGVTVKQAGSKTEAVRMLEEFDKERTSLERSLTLANGAVAELETEYEAAKDELAEAHAKVEEKRVQAARDAAHEARLRFEECLDALVQAKKKVMQTDIDYRQVARAAGVDTPWADLEGRMGHRVYNRMNMPAPTPAWGIAPAPALATRGDDG